MVKPSGGEAPTQRAARMTQFSGDPFCVPGLGFNPMGSSLPVTRNLHLLRSLPKKKGSHRCSTEAPSGFDTKPAKSPIEIAEVCWSVWDSG